MDLIIVWGFFNRIYFSYTASVTPSEVYKWLVNFVTFEKKKISILKKKKNWAQFLVLKIIMILKVQIPVY